MWDEKKQRKAGGYKESNNVKDFGNLKQNLKGFTIELKWSLLIFLITGNSWINAYGLIVLF